MLTSNRFTNFSGNDFEKVGNTPCNWKYVRYWRTIPKKMVRYKSSHKSLWALSPDVSSEKLRIGKTANRYKNNIDSKFPQKKMGILSDKIWCIYWNTKT